MNLCKSMTLLGLIVWASAGCSPEVRVVPPEEPITINMNIKIEHEIRIKVEDDLEEVFNKDSGLF